MWLCARFGVCCTAKYIRAHSDITQSSHTGSLSGGAWRRTHTHTDAHTLSSPLTRHITPLKVVMRVDVLFFAALSAVAAGQPLSTPLPTTTAEAAVMWEADVLWVIQQFGGSLVSYCWRR